MVKWWKFMRFPKAIPKHAFIDWLVIHNRLSTKSRVLKRDINVDLKCAICSLKVESHEHLFF